MFKMLNEMTQRLWEKALGECSQQEVYQAVLQLCKEKMEQMPRVSGNRKLYYVSAEFLIGRLLACNLLNLGLYDDVSKELAAAGMELSMLEDCEPEPSLGNGGLGRLAACFLDSIASLNLPGDGVGLCYHYGLFKQKFHDNKQFEQPDRWRTPVEWLEKENVSFTVPFARFSVEGELYSIDVPGYQTGSKNKLRLFDLKTVDTGLVKNGIDFDKEDILHNLTLFLYPDDSDEAGRMLRIYQQYFMVSCAAQLILKELEEAGHTPGELAEYAVIQINDTHPSMIIPELIRLLMEKGVDFKEAARIVSQTCAYTNHTILAEALEKWPLKSLEAVAPRIVAVIRELDRMVKEEYSDPELAIIQDGIVHMARMDIHYGFSVNGVAALHTEILKSSELNGFYQIYSEKFNNKTNGISFRRWLTACNPALDAFITNRIGDGWKHDSAQLKQLEAFASEKDLEELLQIKQAAKEQLAVFLKDTQKITIDPQSVYDIQIKRMHEYKRQQMNLLYIIWKYQQIKAGILLARPITFLFGAKAAPAYILAKDIIHALLCLSKVIEQDEVASKWLKLVFVENYNVEKAEKLIPAADISEQISLASKEASGTGNMKLMLNGAVTLGTLDGANVEISDRVGEKNIYLFGKHSEEVLKLYQTQSYRSAAYYEHPAVEPLVDFLLAKPMLRQGDAACLGRLYQDITHKDWFMALLDLEEYIQVKEQMLKDYENRTSWAEKMLINVANAGFFSSDRTIAQYEEEIWKLRAE